jgi:hypothetical protein
MTEGLEIIQRAREEESRIVALRPQGAQRLRWAQLTGDVLLRNGTGGIAQPRT